MRTPSQGSHEYDECTQSRIRSSARSLRIDVDSDLDQPSMSENDGHVARSSPVIIGLYLTSQDIAPFSEFINFAVKRFETQIQFGCVEWEKGHVIHSHAVDVCQKMTDPQVSPNTRIRISL